MGMPAARVGDLHACPMFDGPKPHVGGPIIPPCAPTVMTGGMPQARVTDKCTCVGPPDIIVKGSATVMVSKLPAARMLDNTAHGGVIVIGLPTVLIGDSGGGGGSGVGGAGGMGGNAGPFDGVGGATGPLAKAISLPATTTQAGALKQAADSGAPFCERCA